MNTKPDAREFEDFDEEFDFDHLRSGSSEEVLTQAYVEDTGKALIEPDLFTSGEYVVFQEPGAEVSVTKHDDGSITTRVDVADWRHESYMEELAYHKKVFDALPKDQKESVGMIYFLKEYHCCILLTLYGVHRMHDEAEFERVLWREMPYAWVNENKAPKHTIH